MEGAKRRGWIDVHAKAQCARPLIRGVQKFVGLAESRLPDMLCDDATTPVLRRSGPRQPVQCPPGRSGRQRPRKSLSSAVFLRRPARTRRVSSALASTSFAGSARSSAGPRKSQAQSNDQEVPTLARVRPFSAAASASVRRRRSRAVRRRSPSVLRLCSADFSVVGDEFLRFAAGMHGSATAPPEFRQATQTMEIVNVCGGAQDGAADISYAHHIEDRKSRTRRLEEKIDVTLLASLVTRHRSVPE